MDNETKITNVRSLLITITLVVLIITAGTFAWLTYRSKSTAMVLTIGDINDIQITLKPYQLDLELSPVLTYTSLDANQEYVTVSVVNNSSSKQYFSLFYDIYEIDSSLVSNDFKYTVLKSTDNWSTSNVDTSGNFASANTIDDFIILDEIFIPANTTWNYRVYTWVDGSNNPNISNAIFKADLGAKIIGRRVINPVLDSGMIPVTIANDGTVMAVSYDSYKWFNYDNKIWANVVLTTSTNRSTYQAIANGTGSSTVIPSGEILAYYVWIPRYSYKIWTLDASGVHTGDEQTIDIKFVDKNVSETGTLVGQWRTHPAFTFGTDEIDGFWVGKFELTGTASAPTILPNAQSPLISLRYDAFITSLLFAGGNMSGADVVFSGNNTYGLSSIADSHMMKNREWGAVAYLSHSKYGINGQIRINNYRNNDVNLTGCGAGTADAAASEVCDIVYGAASAYPQSSTNNISGIFDLSGGCNDSIMGKYGTAVGNSGFPTMPSEKYCDYYSTSTFTGDYTTNMTLCTLATCGGHALYETRKWYDDSDRFVDSGHDWFLRGGLVSLGSIAGAFTSSIASGSSTYGIRSVIVVNAS